MKDKKYLWIHEETLGNLDPDPKVYNPLRIDEVETDGFIIDTEERMLDRIAYGTTKFAEWKKYELVSESRVDFFELLMSVSILLMARKNDDRTKVETAIGQLEAFIKDWNDELIRSRAWGNRL